MSWRACEGGSKPHGVTVVVQALVEAPGLLTRDYCDRCAPVTPTCVKKTLHALRDRGYAQSHHVAGKGGKGMRKAVVWQPTIALRRLVQRGEIPAIGRERPAPDDDGWQPRPWVHPIRARALGRRAA